MHYVIRPLFQLKLWWTGKRGWRRWRHRVSCMSLLSISRSPALL
jgi:hypothetical protein